MIFSIFTVVHVSHDRSTERRPRSPLYEKNKQEF